MTVGPLNAEAMSEVANFTLKVCTPIYWHDRHARFPKDVEGGSSFILRFGAGLVGVTAAHVFDAYKAARDGNPNLVCQLRLMEFDFRSAIIALDADLDIATFRLSEAELSAIDGTAVDCQGAWPPPVPTSGQGVSLAGFPKVTRFTFADKSMEARAYGALTMIEDVSERDLLFTYDPQREQSLDGLDHPPLGFNMSGCSGGPVLLHGARNGLHRWFPVGMITAGSKRDGYAETVDRGAIQDFDIIRARRLHFIREDGSLDLPQTGWLPGR